LEALLLTHPEIVDSAVIGIKDAKAGELPKGFVVLSPGSTLTPQQVVDFVAANVAHFKKLRGGVEFVDKIPKSAAGKILRRLLRS
jgi:4-coumarate--CoA ligase